jgi:hypothetical protein
LVESNGISKGLNEEFLKICAGVDGSRKVDLVLSGHGHKNFEFRLELDPSNKLLFFHDYYTENPARYYATKLLSESDFNKFKEEAKLEFNPTLHIPFGTAYAKIPGENEISFYYTNGWCSSANIYTS